MFLFSGMPSSKTSLQPQHTESPRTTAQSWESESAATFSVELPTLITEYIHSTEPLPTHARVKGISTEFEVVMGHFSLLDICQTRGGRSSRSLIKCCSWTDKTVINQRKKHLNSTALYSFSFTKTATLKRKLSSFDFPQAKQTKWCSEC